MHVFGSSPTCPLYCDVSICTSTCHPPGAAPSKLMQGMEEAVEVWNANETDVGLEETCVSSEHVLGL